MVHPKITQEIKLYARKQFTDTRMTIEWGLSIIYCCKGSSTNSVYGFPTASDIVDYTKHNGQNGRLLIVLGVLQGKVYFYYPILTISRFYKLPVVSEIMKSIVILK